MFSNEESVRASIDQALHIGSGGDSAFDHKDAVVGNEFRKPVRCFEIDTECFQVAVIYADQDRSRVQRRLCLLGGRAGMREEDGYAAFPQPAASSS